MTAWCSCLVRLQCKTKSLYSIKISLEVSRAHLIMYRSRCEPLTSTNSSLRSRRDECSQKVKPKTSSCLVQNWSNSNSRLILSGQSDRISWRKIKCPKFKIEITITQQPSFLSDGMRWKLLISLSMKMQQYRLRAIGVAKDNSAVARDSRIPSYT